VHPACTIPEPSHTKPCPQSLRPAAAPCQDIVQLQNSSARLLNEPESWRCLLIHTHIRRSILLLTALLALMAVSVSAETTIWGGTFYTGYFIDPESGATLPAPGGILTFGASSSPYGGWVFVTTPVNLWKVPVMATGTPEALGSFCCGAAPTDLAFDAGSGTLYGIDQFSTGYYPAGELFIVDYNNCSNFSCGGTPLDVNMPGVQGIDFVPGRGIYGADLGGGLWFLDPKTLQISFIGDTGIFGVTDLAYDSFTHRLIAVSVGVKDCFLPWQCVPETGMIWSIDPLTAQAVLLNSNAPPMYGLAEITPEPGSVVLFTTGAVGLLAAVRRRLVRFCLSGCFSKPQ